MINYQFKDTLSLEIQVGLVQDGNQDIRNDLLQQYRPFIAKAVSEVCKRYISPTRDDEFSVGLVAFDVAIFSYAAEKGSSFLSFARLVIKRKVIDYIRKEKGKGIALSLDETYHDENFENPTEVMAAKAIYQNKTDHWNRREEISELQEKLAEYKLSFEELTIVSPKHKDARDSAVRVARILYKDEQLREYVVNKKKVPIKALLTKVDVSKKTLERNRKFILAMFIILSEDYIYLKDYLKGVGL
ncbi:RNA polymerase sigma-I factor [Aquibacillus halophilus]|uniref:RNA polymerase sigma factor SigI n=1 Tax=Aquibacillus halophilus TaxID=930132 RepID=A0A6A8DMD6_9BACI|nr:RNA polymerase sigma-I factor [Aquibacillus halophilus]MRH44929.1 RNA polymerase sigma-I factor [Aquibacillus halophilus]